MNYHKKYITSKYKYMALKGGKDKKWAVLWNENETKLKELLLPFNKTITDLGKIYLDIVSESNMPTSRQDIEKLSDKQKELWDLLIEHKLVTIEKKDHGLHTTEYFQLQNAGFMIENFLSIINNDTHKTYDPRVDSYTKSIIQKYIKLMSELEFIK